VLGLIGASVGDDVAAAPSRFASSARPRAAFARAVRRGAARVEQHYEIASSRASSHAAERIQSNRQSSLVSCRGRQLAAQATLESRAPIRCHVVALDGELRATPTTPPSRWLKASRRRHQRALGKLDPAIRSILELMRQHTCSGRPTALPPDSSRMAVKGRDRHLRRLTAAAGVALYARGPRRLSRPPSCGSTSPLLAGRGAPNDVARHLAGTAAPPDLAAEGGPLLAEPAVGPLTRKQRPGFRPPSRT